MKTTVEVSDSLFRAAKQYAASHGITLREVFERGLLAVVQEGGSRRGSPFRIKTITTKGEGLVTDGEWAPIRSKIYEGHGG